MKWFSLIILGAFLALVVYAGGDLPALGDPESPSHVHVSPSYIEGSIPETRTPNIVTAVLADYRGYDTLGETLVIVTAGLAVLLILPRGALRRIR